MIESGIGRVTRFGFVATALLGLQLSARAQLRSGETPPAGYPPDSSPRIAVVTGARLLDKVIRGLPPELLEREYRVCRVSAATQADAEVLFAVADAAIYLPGSNEVLLAAASGASNSLQDLATMFPSLRRPAESAAGALAAPTAGREDAPARQSLAAFLAQTETLLQRKAVDPSFLYVVKVPTGPELPGPGPTLSLPLRRSSQGVNVIYEGFEDDVWSNWSRWDSSGGAYSWGVTGCAARTGRFGVDAVRGGTQGAFLSCGANYPAAIETKMWSSACVYSESDLGWLDFYLRIQTAQEADGAGVYLGPTSATSYYGYWLYGNYGQDGWFHAICNLKQWLGVGDLGRSTCNTLMFVFESDTSVSSGFGARLDDLSITYGSGASVPGQCAVLASALSGEAPLIVTFDPVASGYTGYSWEFGDGFTSTAKSPSHTFQSPGTFWTVLQATSSTCTCGASVKISVTPGPTCAYLLSSPGTSFPSTGGPGSVNVTAPAGCGWNATPNVPWITITGGATGSGRAIVTFDVAPNTGPARTGAISIANQAFTISQATGCSYGLAVSKSAFDSSGGTGTVMVTTDAGCAWTATSSAAWLAITGGTAGSGPGTVLFSVGANAGSARSGSLAVAGQTVTISQAAGASCISPTVVTQPASRSVFKGESVTLSVAGAGTAPLAYQWYTGDGYFSEPITGATSSTYKTPALERTTSYYVQISNSCGQISSSLATVTVTEGKTYIIPSVAHSPGAAGTQWRTDVAVVNPGASAITLSIEFVNVATGDIIGHEAALPANATAEWTDIVVTLFDLDPAQSAKGVVRVRASTQVALSSRTYNQKSATETFGQWYPALETGSGLAPGKVGFLPQLRQSAGFRTNIGVVNLGSAPVSVRIRLFDRAGRQVGTDTPVDVSVGSWSQIDRVFERAGAGSQDLGYARVEVLTSGGFIWAYASVVDNTTGDPTTIPVEVF